MSTNLTNEICSSIENHRPDRFFVGDWFYWRCEYEKAKEHFQGILKDPDLNDSDLVRCYKALAAVEVGLKNYDEALKFYNQQIQLFERSSTNNKDDIISCYTSIGKTYWLKGDHNQAFASYLKALDYAEHCTVSPSSISAIYKNLANICIKTKQFDLALKYFNEALKIDSEQQPINHLQIGQTYANMAAMYQSQPNQEEEALNYFRKARETLLKSVSETHVAIEKIDGIVAKIKDILARNNIMVLWLDDHIGQEDNCRALKMEFRQITNSLKMFDSVDGFRQCLPHVKHRKLFCIIQGKHAKEVVPDIEQIVLPSMEPFVYIFCLNMQHLKEWALDQECIMKGGMFDHEGDLFGQLKSDVTEYVKQNKVNDQNKISADMVVKYLEQLMQIFKRCYQEEDTKISFKQNTPITT